MRKKKHMAHRGMGRRWTGKPFLIVAKKGPILYSGKREGRQKDSIIRMPVLLTGGNARLRKQKKQKKKNNKFCRVYGDGALGGA